VKLVGEEDGAGSARWSGTDDVTDVVYPQHCTWLRIGAWPADSRNASHANTEAHIKVSFIGCYNRYLDFVW